MKSLDFDPGPINGRVSARTGEAIRQFQTMAGSTPDGAASPDLLKQLREIVAPPRR